MLTAVYAVLVLSTTCLADWTGLPTVPFTASGGGTFDLAQLNKIVVDTEYADAKDTDGWTLIPPSLLAFAETFAADMAAISPSVPAISVECEKQAAAGQVFLTVANNSDFRDAADRWTSEAYAINVTNTGVIITGASPLGVWWGTRSLLQQAALHDGRIETGYGVDSPGWGTRGIFLDAGRHYYPPEFLIEMCSWISFYKQNTFHVHLSDNLYNNIEIYSMERQQELYSAFRLWSDEPALAGLNRRRNESYTRQDFDYIQSSCAARGVTVIPEIEMPGHALVFTQWKPELAIAEQFDLLNITYPDTIPLMETIWKTFLPWFHSKVVHIGADEYVDNTLSKDALAEVYNDFVNAMNSYISATGNKTIRIWGTFPPKSNYTNNISTNVTLQHWEFFEDYPYQDYIQNGYKVINSDDHTYLVQKYSTSYPQQLHNTTLLFHGNPEDGTAFAPHIFDPNNATNNPPRNSPGVLGHVAAQWNDYGPNTSTYLEAYYPWRDYLPALADKQWGGNILEDEYADVWEKLQKVAPGQNLDRRVDSKGDVIVEYDFTKISLAEVVAGYEHENGMMMVIPDLSGNGYHAKSTCNVVPTTPDDDDDGSTTAIHISPHCTFSTPLTSKGQNYTLSFTLQQTSTSTGGEGGGGGSIFTGPDSELRSGNGTSTQLMLVSAGNAFALNYSLPIGEWVEAKLMGRGNRTFFAVAGMEDEMEFRTVVGVNGERFAWSEMAIVAPLNVVGGGGWEGLLKRMKLVDYAV